MTGRAGDLPCSSELSITDTCN